MWDILIEYLTKKNSSGEKISSQNYFCDFFILYWLCQMQTSRLNSAAVSFMSRPISRNRISSPKAMAMASWKERNISWPGTSWHLWQNNRWLQKCVSLFNFIADAWKWSGMCLSSSNKWTSDILTPPSRCKWVQMTFGFYWEVRKRSDAANFLSKVIEYSIL